MTVRLRFFWSDGGGDGGDGGVTVLWVTIKPRLVGLGSTGAQAGAARPR